MEALREALAALRQFDLHLFTVGKAEVTLWSIVTVLVSLCVLFILAGWIRGWIVHRLLGKSRLDRSTREAIGTITRYVVLVAGFMIVMQTAGINLTTFNVLAGAVGVGIGFGLQDIVKNFISGLIIMFDRPIHIGDRIEIGGAQGEVVDIGARRVTLTTPEGITVVVPNGKLITETVKNLHGAGSATALVVPLSIARDSDPRLAQRIIVETARANERVAQQPAPFVRIKLPAGNAFPLELELWTPLQYRERDELLNELHYALHEKLSAAGVKLV
jgi:small-conductance mechanosensitive channel